MDPQRPLRSSRRAQAALLISTLLGAAACGGPDVVPEATAAHSGILARLVLDGVETTVADREVREIAGFWMSDTNGRQCPWEFDGPQQRVMTRVRRTAGIEDREEFMPAMALRGAGPKSFTHRFEYLAGDVTTVDVIASCYGLGPERLRVVTLDDAGEPAATTEWIEVRGRPAPYVLSFSFPRRGDVSARRTGVRLEFEGNLAHSALLAMRAMQTPVGARLPCVGVGELVRVGQEWRHAAGLIEGSPWSVEVTNAEPEAGPVRLSLDALVPPSSSRSSRSARLAVSWMGAAGPVVRRVAVPKTAIRGWGPVALELKDLVPGASRVELALEDGDAAHSSSVAIGDAVISQRSKAARSFLLITSDTHRADHMGAAPSAAFVETPALDRLGSRGLFFTNCQSTTNVTNPSHIAMLTGVHPRDTQIVDNKTRLAERVETLSEVFRAHGYRTFASISTQHLDPEQSGLGQGFDRFEAPSEFKRSGNVAVDKVHAWLQEADGQPVFAWIHMFDAHAPYGPPEDQRDRVTRGLTETSPTGLGADDVYLPGWIRNAGITNPDYVDALYRGEVDWVDVALSGLFEDPALRDATIAFTSDHGESLRTHSIYWDHAGLYLPMVQVPMILAGPSIQPRRTDVGVQQMDIGRTLLDLAGIEASFAGRNLVELAETNAPDEPRFAISAHGLQASVSSGDWFLTFDLRTYSTDSVEHAWTKGRMQLFDRTLGTDTELELSEEYPDIAERMRDRLIVFLEEASSARLGQTQELSAEAESNLEALGYAAFSDRVGTTWWTPGEAQGSGAAPDKRGRRGGD